MASPFAKLPDRKLVQWSLAYLAGAWVVLETLAFATDTFELPAAILRVVTVLSLFGLHAVLVVAWFHGEKGEQRIPPLEAALLLLLVVGGAGSALWAARPPVGGAPAPVASTPAPAPDRSVAVLPFVNMSGRAEEDYFSDGVTEEILNALAQVQGLRVAARTSSFSFKGKNEDVRSIGERLGVRAVLEGSVRRDDDRIKITAQLIDAGTGYHLWSNTFNRSDADLFAVQDEIARAIANALELRLAPKDTEHRPPTRDAPAYDLYLKGREAWNERSETSLPRAIALFEEAVALDPGFAVAYSGLADAYALLEDYGKIPAEEAFPRAIHAAQQALEIDETLAEANASLGHVYMHQFRWREAEEEFRRALSLNPSYANAHHWYSVQLLWTGRYDEALRESRIAREVDPLSEKFDEAAGVILSYAGRGDEAVEHLRGVVERYPTDLAYRNLAYALSMLGRHDEAIAAAHRIRELPGGPGPITEVRVLAQAGRREEARVLLDDLMRTRPELRRTHEDIHAILVALGEAEEAIEVIGEATPSSLLYIGIDPAYDPIREDPRFRGHLARLGFSRVAPAARMETTDPDGGRT
jgi:TolB-like protein/Flp pilus assembly protein TadD